MPRLAKRLLGFAAALGITLVVFGFFFLVISQFEDQLPQPQPGVVTVDIYPSKPKP
jgi:hypothetical protein